MIDSGLNKGMVQKFDTKSINTQKSFFGFRKMFRDYLNKLNVGFYDTCCPSTDNKLPVYVDKITKQLMYIDANGIAKVAFSTIGPVA